MIDDKFSSLIESFHIDTKYYMKYDNNPYIQSLFDTADLKILQSDLVNQQHFFFKKIRDNRAEQLPGVCYFCPVLVPGQ